MLEKRRHEQHERGRSLESARKNLHRSIGRLSRNMDRVSRPRNSTLKTRERERQLALRHNGDWNEDMLPVFGSILGAGAAVALNRLGAPYPGAAVAAGYVVGSIASALLSEAKWRDYLEGKTSKSPEKPDTKHPEQYLGTPGWYKKLDQLLGFSN